MRTACERVRFILFIVYFSRSCTPLSSFSLFPLKIKNMFFTRKYIKKIFFYFLKIIFDININFSKNTFQTQKQTRLVYIRFIVYPFSFKSKPVRFIFIVYFSRSCSPLSSFSLFFLKIKRIFF